VAGHPFFKDSKGRFIKNKRDEKMRVVGFSEPVRHPQRMERARSRKNSARNAMTPDVKAH